MLANKGQNIMEFVIIIALVVIAAVVALTLFGDNVKTMFSKSEKKYETFKPFEWENQKSNSNSNSLPGLKGGDLKGTPDEPVIECKGNSCTIDFGTFVLEGVPKSFNDSVRTSGTSGGTEEIVSLLLQIAAQLEAAGELDQASLIRDLANIGHNVAFAERSIETVINSCDPNLMLTGCIQNVSDDPIAIDKGFDHALTPLEKDISLKDLALQVELDEVPGFTPDEYNNWCAAGELKCVFYDKYQEVMKDQIIQDEVKDVVSELSWVMATLGGEFQGLTAYGLGNDPGTANFLKPEETDGLEGFIPAELEELNAGGFTVQDFRDYKASTISNFSAGLMCASGSHQDVANKCH